MKAIISLAARTMKIRMEPRKQAGAIPYKITNKMNIKFMLVQKTGSGKWGFPKGKVETHLTKKRSALVEAYEEAGISGVIKGNVGRYSYIKNKTKRMQKVDLYLMEVEKTYKDYLETDRVRKWFSYDAALKALPREQMPFLVIAGRMIQDEYGHDL